MTTLRVFLVLSFAMLRALALRISRSWVLKAQSKRLQPGITATDASATWRTDLSPVCPSGECLLLIDVRHEVIYAHSSARLGGRSVSRYKS